MTPETLGRYEILGELGKGAMGVVYLAQDPLIQRQLAIKTFRMAYSAKEKEVQQFRERFLREAQAIGQLSHPNVVTVHDLGQEDDEYFIAMEYVKGVNLKQRMQREEGPLPLDFVIDVAAQIAEGLAGAHAKGIVHRDVKPANIIITHDQQVKITDFGIARIDQSNLTVAGQLLGTPNYMAPEQIQGKAVDARTDIFSLGVLLYEMLTRKKPFAGENLTQVSHRIVYDDFTPPDEYVEGLPPELNEILQRALCKDPDERYQDAAEMARDLQVLLEVEEALTGQVPTAAPPEPEPEAPEMLEVSDAAAAAEPAAPPAVRVEEAEVTAPQIPEPARVSEPIPEPEQAQAAGEPPAPEAAPAFQEPEVRPASGGLASASGGPPPPQETAPSSEFSVEFPASQAIPAEVSTTPASTSLPPPPPRSSEVSAEFPASDARPPTSSVPFAESSPPPPVSEFLSSGPLPEPPSGPVKAEIGADPRPPAPPPAGRTSSAGRGAGLRIGLGLLAFVAIGASILALVFGGSEPPTGEDPGAPTLEDLRREEASLIVRAEGLAESGDPAAALDVLFAAMNRQPLHGKLVPVYLRISSQVAPEQDILQEYIQERMTGASDLISRKEYEAAYTVLEQILFVDDQNEWALQKGEDIQRHISKPRREEIRRGTQNRKTSPPSEAPPPTAVVAPPPPPPPVDVAISFRTLVAEGSVTVYANGQTVLQEAFNFPNRKTFKKKLLRGERGFDRSHAFQTGTIEFVVEVEVEAKDGRQTLGKQTLGGNIVAGMPRTLTVVVQEDLTLDVRFE